MKFLEIFSVVRVRAFTRAPAGGVKADDTTIIRKFGASDAASLGYIQAQLEGDYIVVCEPKLVWMVNWRIGECIKFILVSNVSFLSYFQCSAADSISLGNVNSLAYVGAR